MKTITKAIVECHNYAYYLKERYTTSLVEAEFKDITDWFFKKILNCLGGLYNYMCVTEDIIQDSV